MRKFKTESQRVLDLMINSIYTHKEIFIRELLSNCSDAIDKLYYKGGFSRDEFAIEIATDEKARTLTISDNGIGMTAEELENNLGVIAHSGSLEFKQGLEEGNDVNIIGQFGVGFYSAFMVAKKVEVLSKAYGSQEANLWTSCGTEGYEIKKAEKDKNGTSITLYLKDDTEDERYSEYLEEYRIRELVKKYSDYIRYPINMETVHEHDGETHTHTETLNTMVPLWKKNKNEIKPEEYDEFYKNNFFDSEAPLLTIHTSAEGAVEYKALLFIPARPQYNYYSKSFEKGLRLYTDGVLITDLCKELIPDYFSFVKGLVDSDLTLNISRETIQHNRQLMKIAANIEKKIKNELLAMLKNDREKYVKFYEAFGLQLKYGIYDNWGNNKELLQDLIMFHSVKEDKLVTLEEYVAAMPESQKFIYYATGSSISGIKALPQCEKVLDLGYDILCLTDNVDEFAIKFMNGYAEKEFRSVSGGDLGLDTTSEELSDPELTDYIKEVLGDKVAKVRVSGRLKTHAVCLTSEGELTIEMEKVLNSVPNAPKDQLKATKVLEINGSHPIYETMKALLSSDKERLKTIAEVLYDQALIIEGMPVDDPTGLTDRICNLLAK